MDLKISGLLQKACPLIECPEKAVAPHSHLACGECGTVLFQNRFCKNCRTFVEGFRPTIAA